MTEAKTEQQFKQWAILELMGHRKLAGLVSEESRFGTVMCRIDIPGPEGKSVTQFYGGSSIYAVTPCTEDLARAVAKSNQPAPVQRWELPQLAAKSNVTDADVAAELGENFDDEENPLP